ncbi:MAG: hypothetical protein AABW99_02050 [archaeon]
MLEIKATFFPFRLKLSRREPVQLKFSITNVGKETEMVSYEVSTNTALSFDSTGFKAKIMNRIGSMEPGKGTEQYADLFPKPYLREGTHKMTISATEHYKNYDFVKRQYTKTLELIIDP